MVLRGQELGGQLPAELADQDWTGVRPARAISLPVGQISGKLLSVAGLLTGWSLRESQGASSASSSGGAQANNSSIAAQVGSVALCSGFEITGGGATAALEVVATLTGVVGGPLSYVISVPVGATVGINPLAVAFSPPLVASAANQAITINVPTFGAGNTNAASVIHGGYQAQVDLWDGGDTTGQLMASLQLLPGQHDQEWLDDSSLFFDNGLFFSLVSGQVKGAVNARW